MHTPLEIKTVEVALASNGYPVYLGCGLLSESSLWDRHLGAGKTLIVSNDVVAPLYLEQLKSALGRKVEITPSHLDMSIDDALVLLIILNVG